MHDSYPELTAYMLDALLRNDRKIREVCPPRNRQEWGFERVNNYLRAVGLETIEEGGEEALWRLMRRSIALLPHRREKAMHRLVRLWAPFGWLDDQDIPMPTLPAKYREPAIDRITG
jgi:hypothetical protein